MTSTTRSPLTVTEVSGLTVGVFPPEVDVSNAHVIRDEALRLLDDGAAALILDLTTTRFCDCAGVTAILRVGRRAASLHTPVCLVLPATGPVHRIAAMTGLTERFPVSSSVAAARDVLTRPV